MQKIKVLVIDASVVFRAHLKKIINRLEDMEIVGTASDAVQARALLATLAPDVMTLDLELPKMCGLAFLEEIMSQHSFPVVVITSPSMQKADVRLRALELGAIDFIPKPRMDVRTQLHVHDAEIISRIRLAKEASVAKRAPIPAPAPPVSQPATVQTLPPDTPPVAPERSTPVASNKVLVFGASAGGTNALKEVLVQLPPDCPGIVIAQHMPEHFAQTFATRLDELCQIKVKEAEQGEIIQPGHAYLAPGDAHLLLGRSGNHYVCELSQEAPVNRHRPSVDVLFNSAARTAGRHAIGVIFTGMGKDGAAGLHEMHRVGAHTIAQDEASCIVFGMPREAIAQGGVDRVIALKNIAQYILDYLKKDSAPKPEAKVAAQPDNGDVQQ